MRARLKKILAGKRLVDISSYSFKANDESG